ncbi:GNAT family N-acetyltransferase [Anaerolineales bacterium HSG6]|nr:GNAT family N-acetyltransferase [Anaerolineales bacterium HSG6]MDM8530263.1 GNAT family N-acetyltransferase [Anaerolineales bacterium HSG25]
MEAIKDIPQTVDTLIIRFATHIDLARISHVAQVTWDDTYSDTIAVENRRDFLSSSYNPTNLAEAIDTSGHWFYVAEMDDKVIGFGHFIRRYHPTQGRAELIRFYVLPDYQNMGIGRSLLNMGFSGLTQAAIKQCSVSVQATNHRARRLYERHGFVYYRKHGQFLGTQIVTLAQYIRPVTNMDLINSHNQ